MKCNRKLGAGRMATKAKPEGKESYMTPKARKTFQKATISLLAFVLSGVVWCAGLAESTSDYRQLMRDFVRAISKVAKAVDPAFIVIPQNGEALLTETGLPDGPLALEYLKAIDGIGREDLFYGYEADNVPTPQADQERMIAFLDLAEATGIEVLMTDYCWSKQFVDDSYAKSAKRRYVSFAADHRELDSIPQYPNRPTNENAAEVHSLSEAQNFLYLINPSAFSDRSCCVAALGQTNYDLLIIDAFFDDLALTLTEIASLKTKKNGGARLVIAYMSIGEAENYRYYWQLQWLDKPPSWLLEENPDWPGNYKVHYWDPDWQAIISGYLGKILAAGFDGVYLDLIDAYEYFEK